jgi:SAM-dependent methyltransferase
MTVHQSAASGFAKDAGTYQKGRPDYPPALQGWLTASLGLDANAEVIDLGAGTGKFTKILAKTNAKVRAIEPVAAMRLEFAKTLPAIPVLEGTATAIPLADASLDAVVCAQAFHWFASPEAVAEIHRVLKPGGRLGLIWNVRDESVAWVKALTGIITPYEGDTPRFHTGQWQAVFPAPGFGRLEETRFPHEHRGPAETVIIARTMSVSFIAALPDETRARVEADVRNLIAKTPELAGQAEVTFPYETRAYVCRRLPHLGVPSL